MTPEPMAEQLKAKQDVETTSAPIITGTCWPCPRCGRFVATNLCPWCGHIAVPMQEKAGLPIHDTQAAIRELCAALKADAEARRLLTERIDRIVERFEKVLPMLVLKGIEP